MKKAGLLFGGVGALPLTALRAALPAAHGRIDEGDVSALRHDSPRYHPTSHLTTPLRIPRRGDRFRFAATKNVLIKPSLS